MNGGSRGLGRRNRKLRRWNLQRLVAQRVEQDAGQVAFAEIWQDYHD